MQSSSRSKPAVLPKSQQQEVNWHKSMLEKVGALEEKYSKKYSPTMDNNGVIHSAKVMVPRIDFSKIKPHLHRNLPKPGYYPLHGCSPDPDFYHKATQSQGYERGCQPKFECLTPFGLKAAFDTNLGLVAVPEEPIGGYIYKSGTGDSTTWQLFPERSPSTYKFTLSGFLYLH